MRDGVGLLVVVVVVVVGVAFVVVVARTPSPCCARIVQGTQITPSYSAREAPPRPERACNGIRFIN